MIRFLRSARYRGHASDDAYETTRPNVSRRLTIIFSCLILFGISIVGRLFYLQVVQHGEWVARAAGQQESERSLFAERGSIYIQDASQPTGLTPVALNRQYFFLYAIPSVIRNPRQTAKIIAPLLSLNEDALYEKFRKEDDPWEPIKHRVTEESWSNIRALNLPGIAAVSEPWRYYPEKTFASHVLGFVGFFDEKQRGQYGVEGYLDSVLRGKEGTFRFARDAKGEVIVSAEQDMTPAEDGADVILTIDRHAQFAACAALQSAVTQHEATGGSVIIMDPATGAIRALCNVPSFDPNVYNEVDDSFVFNNPAIFLDYEPGSTMKAMTMAAGLETGVVQPESTYVDKGFVQLGKHTMRNSDYQAHGEQTMVQVLEKSLNTGAIHVARLMEQETFRSYVRAFGFGAKTGVELATEVSGDTRSLDKSGQIYTATASFGQGITATPMQLIAAYGAIGNGGILKKPYIVQEIRYADGRVERTQPMEVRRVISERTAALLSGMLVFVVQGQHGKRAGVPGYTVAGKTGTAQIARRDGPGYEEGAYIGTFVGFAPVPDPRFVMLAKIDRPKGVRFAESTAAPLFGDIARFLLQYYKIAPDTEL